MPICKLDPLTDPRWPDFVASHPASSAFHTVGWLTALKATHGYRPIAFTSSAGRSLDNAVVFCDVQSWLTGGRLVSLPFSDHCQPLASGDDLIQILQAITPTRSGERRKYVELRPISSEGMDASDLGYGESERFSFQAIDLSPDLDTIYRRFHSSCIRRKIKRAERENLVYEGGTSTELLGKFLHLLMLTRRRHRLPPQPASWFRNILRGMGANATIHVLSKDSVPVASMLTLTHKATLIYKYGCSDFEYNSLGAVPALFWRVIQHAHATGKLTFDLGRSGLEDPGLSTFKEHLGATTIPLIYQRTPPPSPKQSEMVGKVSGTARHLLSRLPDPLFSGVGQILYRHMA
jgi:hypothetical protein